MIRSIKVFIYRNMALNNRRSSSNSANGNCNTSLVSGVSNRNTILVQGIHVSQIDFVERSWVRTVAMQDRNLYSKGFDKFHTSIYLMLDGHSCRYDHWFFRTSNMFQ